MAYRILIGGTVSAPEYAFSDEISMGSIRQTLNMDIVGTELAYDVMDAEIDYEVGAALLWSPKDYSGVITADGFYFGTADPGAPDIAEVPYGTVCWLLNDSTIISKMYVKEIVQIGKAKYQLETISAVGLLDERQHLGAIYTSTTAGDVLSDIIGNAFPYTVAPNVSSQIVRGALPPGTCRESLHMLMFALGIALDKDENGDPVFTFLDSAAVPTDIPATRIFEAGGSVDFSTPATGVEVAEHSFYQLPAQSELEQLFSNLGGVAVDHLLVQFAGPRFDLTASGLTINEQGPYYAILTGIGVLSGRAYTHNTRTQQLAVADPSGDKNIITSTEDTLVNLLNAENVARRLLAYYASKRTVKRTVQLDAEKPGQSVILADAFGVSAQGYIAASDVRIGSRMRKSELKIISGYTPTGQGNNYTTMTRITASGTWTVPAGVTHIRIVVIGGGTGGGGGHNGQDGRGGDKGYGGWQTYQEESFQGEVYRKVYGYATGDGDEAGHGGSGGSGGVGGTFVVLDLDVTPGETFTVTVGSGGSGGAVSAYDADDTVGTAGTDTSIVSDHGTISSAGGQLVAEGYYDPINNEVYAAAGGNGVTGGDGGTTTVTSNNGFGGNDLAGVSGKPGTGTGAYAGGSGGAGLYSEDVLIIHAGGGGGGGAAQGAAGGAGGSATLSGSTYQGGTGGNGANAAAPAVAGYGCGGNGGHGGGGGGNAGGADIRGQISGKSVAAGVGGTGGTGSAGANGGGGCVLIYY